MSKKYEFLSFCLIIGLAALLRFAGISNDSLWLDESYQSLVGACGQGMPDFTSPRVEKFLFRFEKPEPVSEMLAKFREVDPLCPPLYALTLNRWMAVFGASDFALRSLSACISIFSVLVLFAFARFLLPAQAAHLTALLQAVSPFDIHYGQEVRMYSLVYLSALVSGAGLIAILKTELKSRISLLLLPLYAISTAAMVNSHYTTLFLALSQGLASLCFLIKTARWRLLALLFASWLFAGLACLPWLPMFLQSAAIRKASFYVTRTADLIWPFKALFFRIPANWLSFLSGQRVIAYAAGVYLSSALMLLSALYFFRKDRSASFSLSALWLWVLLPTISLFLSDLLENRAVIQVPRYLIFTAPAVYLLAGYGLSKLCRHRRVFFCLLSAHLVFSGGNLIYTHTVKQREPWRELAKEVERLVDPDMLLVVSQHYDIACLDRYLTLPRKQVGMSPAMGESKIAEGLAAVSSFALVTAQDGEAITDLIPKEFKLKDRVDLSHGLHLRIYER